MKLANLTSVYRARIVEKALLNWLDGKIKSILDVGCGTGVVADEIGKRFEVEVTGCDIEKYLIRPIKFKKMKSAVKLPFKSGKFGLAMINDVLHHTKYTTQVKLIKESLRVAEAVYIFELKPTLLGKTGDFIMNKIHNPNMKILYTYRGKEEWEKLFRKENIEYQSKIVESPLIYPFSHLAFYLK